MSQATPWDYMELANGGFALVDEDDIDLIKDFRWRWRRDTSTRIYVVASGPTGGDTYRMHRVILGVTDPNMHVDHINGNPFDNRRCNLRVATNSSNQQNRQNYARGHSKFKGVTLHRQTGKWQAQIKLNGRSKYLGLFDDELMAALAYDQAAADLFGEFAAVNFAEGEAA